MSIAHPTFCATVERLAAGGSLTSSDRQLLENYAAPACEQTLEDKLDRVTREAVERLTGADDVWSPRRAARALLASPSTG
jgi:hypothetical protein